MKFSHWTFGFAQLFVEMTCFSSLFSETRIFFSKLSENIRNVFVFVCCQPNYSNFHQHQLVIYIFVSTLEMYMAISVCRRQSCTIKTTPTGVLTCLLQSYCAYSETMLSKRALECLNSVHFSSQQPWRSVKN